MKRLSWLSVLCIVFQTQVLWAIPTEINYQGALKVKGLPATAPVDLTFLVTNFDGTQTYSQPVIIKQLKPINGLFSVKLNFQLNSPHTWESITPYIKVNVDGTDLGPPEKISATLYAVMSNTVVDNAITTSKLDPSVQTSIFVPGMVVSFAGSTAPAGWLLCDGHVYAQSSYLALFNAIGPTWNTGGEGAGNFRVPDLRGRAPIGAGQGPGLTNRALSQVLGEESHLLVTAEMPVHTHGITDPGHAHTFYTGSGNFVGLVSDWNGNGGTTVGNANTTRSSVTGIGINNAGGGASHNVMQPSAAINFIIKI